MLWLDVSGTWLAAGVAVGAALLTLAAVLVGSIALLSSQRRARRELTLIHESTVGTEATLDKLTRSLDDAWSEIERTQQRAEIGTTLELDVVLARVLESTQSLPGAVAAVLRLSNDSELGSDQPGLVVWGLDERTAARNPVTGPPDGGPSRAVIVQFEYQSPSEASFRGGVSVPLLTEREDPQGSLTVYWGTEATVPEGLLTSLEELAATASPAIENARRFRHARQLADLDALTGLHNRRYFHEMLASEVARAHRYKRDLALVVIDVDNFKAINDRVGHLAGDAVLAEIAERMQAVVRSADIACRVGGDEFAVILPESTLTDAEQLYQRLQNAVSSRSSGSLEQLWLSAGIAELRLEDDAVSFFERADELLYRAKEVGKGRAVATEQ